MITAAKCLSHFEQNILHKTPVCVVWGIVHMISGSLVCLKFINTLSQGDNACNVVKAVINTYVGLYSMYDLPLMNKVIDVKKRLFRY